MEHLTQNSHPSFYTFEGNFIFFGGGCCTGIRRSFTSLKNRNRPFSSTTGLGLKHRQLHANSVSFWELSEGTKAGELGRRTCLPRLEMYGAFMRFDDLFCGKIGMTACRRYESVDYCRSMSGSIYWSLCFFTVWAETFNFTQPRFLNEVSHYECPINKIITLEK